MALAILRCLLFGRRLVSVVGCFLFRVSLVCVVSSRCVVLWLFLALVARRVLFFGLAVCFSFLWFFPCGGFFLDDRWKPLFLRFP